MVATAIAVFLFASSVVLAQVRDDTSRPQERSSVYVESVTLTEVAALSGLNLNVGAVVSSREFARGLQKAADVYGLKLNVFVSASAEERARIAKRLIEQGDDYLIVDQLPGENWSSILAQAKARGAGARVTPAPDKDSFDGGMNALREARGSLVSRIPKYDEILPIAFPISPLPDTFFQPSKFPYPSPLIRAPRTNESASASMHAHTSCNMVAQTGNMLHRTSSIDPNRLLMGMEGGNLALQALPGAIDKQKLSAVMTSWVLNVADGGKRREILVENNGIESSLFTVGIHAPEELEIGLSDWAKRKQIRGFKILDYEHVLIEQWEGKDRVLRAGMFLIANDRNAKTPVLIPGRDMYGAYTIDFFTTQAFAQQLVEVGATNKNSPVGKPTGGILTAGGTTLGHQFGRPLSESLREVHQTNAPVPPHVFNFEGGFVVVTPEVPLTAADLSSTVKRIYLDLRGPLTSDQTITVDVDGPTTKRIVFRRTVLDFDQLDEALNGLKSLGLISGWEYEGSRGRGIFANVVLKDFLGKHRKFMSSLATWPTDEKPGRPIVRMYVDGMQRLNFGLVTADGWRQEFVEVPLRIPPVPRDVALYSGRSSLD